MATEKEKYLAWFENAKKNEGLISVDIFPGNFAEKEEDLYAELNHFNAQMDTVEPLYEVVF